VPSEDDALTASLVRAFRDDPLLNWGFRAGRGRERGWGVYFRTTLELYRPFGAVFSLDSGLGCAVWIPPEKWRLSIGRELLLAPRILSILGWRRLVRGLRAVHRIEAQHPLEPHYYLQVMGVDPTLQGRGLGGHLVTAGLERVDREGLGAYLETTKERNLAFYRRHGFEVSCTYDFGPGSPTCWGMWRPPRQTP
jgi:hypothetical protein